MTVYYVDATTGNDGDAGTSEALAWQTLGKVSTEFANGTFGAGDQILLKRGETWTVTGGASALEIKGSSGSFGNHIYIGPYGTGARPVITHSGLTEIWLIGRWGGAAANYITIEGLELTDGYKTSMINAWSCAYWILKDLLIHDSDAAGSPPAEGISIHDNSHHIWVMDCEIYNCEGEAVYIGKTTSTPQSDYTRRVTVHNGNFHDNYNEGVDLKGISTSCFVTDCKLEDNAVGAGWDVSQFNLGGRYHRVMNCRIKGAAGANRYGMNFFYTYSTLGCRYIKVDRCLFDSCGGASHAALRYNGHDNQVTNCTFYNSPGEAMWIRSSWPTTTAGQKAYNNIFDTTAGYDVLCEANCDKRLFDFDYNDYGDGSAGIWYWGASRDLNYVQGTLGQEANGISDDPSFAETDNFTLDAGSPCVNAGDSAATTWNWKLEYGTGAPSGAVDMGWRENGWPLPERVFHSNFNTLDDFTGSSGVSLTAAARYSGNYGGSISIADTVSKYIYRAALGNLDYLYTRLYFDADNVTMASGDEFTLLEVQDDSSNVLGRVTLSYDGADKRVRAAIIDDADTLHWTGYTVANSGWNQIELFWMRSVYSSHADWGEIILYLNGDMAATVTGINNDSRTADEIWAGAVSGLDAGTSGTLYIDLLTADEVREIGTLSLESSSLTGDAAIKAAASSSLTADSIVKRAALSGSVTADALLLRPAIAGSVTADATVAAAVASSVYGNAAILAAATGSVTADTIVRRADVSGSVTADAIVQQAAVASSIIANSTIKAVASASVSADGAIKVAKLGSLTGDAIIRQPDRSGSITADGRIVYTTSDSLAGNATIQAAQSASVTADAIVGGLTPRSGSITGDAIIKAEQAVSLAGDATIKQGASASIAGDAVVRETGLASSITGDAIVKRTGIPGSVTGDSIVRGTPTASITAAATIKQSTSQSVTGNAMIKEAALSGSITGDALVMVGRSGSIATDSIIKATQAGSITSASTIETAASGTFTASALILQARSETLGADATVKATVSGSITAAAQIQLGPATSVGPDLWAAAQLVPVIRSAVPTERQS